MDSIANNTCNVTHLPPAVTISVTQDMPVFPCRPDKKPYTGNGFKNATYNPHQIIKWWEKWPDALLGMPTGKMSGYCILDVDDKNGHDGSGSLHALEQQHGKLPDTWITLTPSGGFHYWFKYPGQHIQTSAGKIGQGLDIRGDGGYVIIPPSAGYEFEASNPHEPAEMPEWLVELASQKKKKRNKQKVNQQKNKPLSIKRKGKSYFNRLPVTQKFHQFPTDKYKAEFIGWTVLEPKAFILREGDVRIEMRFKVFASNRHFYISSYHLVSILKAPKLQGQIQTGRGSSLAASLNSVIGGIAKDGYPIVIDLNDVDVDVFMDRQLTVTVSMTKKATPPYAYITHIGPCCS